MHMLKGLTHNLHTLVLPRADVRDSAYIGIKEYLITTTMLVEYWVYLRTILIIQNDHLTDLYVREIHVKV